MCAKPLPIVPQLPDDPLSRYALEMLHLRQPISPIDDVLREQEELAARDNVPIIGPLEGAIIQTLLHVRQPPARNALDIGGAIGYSAIWLARALPPDGRVISIEIDQQRADLAQHFIDKAGLHNRISVMVGNVFELLPDLDVQFDVILQDVIKHIYFGADSGLALRLLDLCLGCLADDGLLLSDNAFCMGEVLHNSAKGLPNQVSGIIAYNREIASNPNLESVIIPVRDGLWVSQRT
jgi:predicted O-methyltransferase YrrM